ncbi:peptide ABC transporter permease [Nostoc sp. 'Peltigera membranacea cyanobiont' 213]|uniref:ShlB/FhaC/HecB family hemolysin secretion/activation protein n=1 Tax=unclassified Nostoc TaxID=2593658 RepID=UPI000B95B7E3|nr:MULTISPECIES: ShlB/FhaC/HecB family hemolysin secretion/activation protein [unclassified Nostoc]AVH66671.1 hemolysin activation/secretion protein [Nostoc sp. 'Peltigera membranacea cyanobiont' N6]OYD98261.1 peptide ABC transporter permease [Nostoc sp. 'Peltigera membranacea cyanobiont' 213]
MRWYLKFRVQCVFLVPGVLLVASISPSYGDLSNSSVFLELPQILAQAANPEGDPNRQRFPQSAPAPEPLPPETQKPVQPIPTPEPSSVPVVESIQVKKIEVTGSTILKSEQLNAITRPVEGRSVSLEELRKVADDITQIYLERGYITSRAILVDQAITGGVVQIRVIEGGLEKIEIQGTKRLNPDYVRSRVSLGASRPLSTANLEDQLRLLRSDPLLSNVEASLRTGSGVGQSILVVRVTEADAFDGTVSIDNYSPPSVGSERLGVTGSYRNLTGMGDELAAAYYRTTEGGSNIYDFSYRLPLNAMNGTLQLRTTISNNEVIQEPFKSFDIRGESQLYEISYRQPLVRSPREEFALSFGFTVQNGQTFTFAGATPFGFGPDKDGNSRTRVIKFGQDYVLRDVTGAWALRSLFSLGLGTFDATINPDPVPDGRFFSWLAQVQRVQRLNDINLLIAQAEVQLTPNGLLPSQQFVIGGGQSLRGYRQNARAGDNGVRFSLENRLTLEKDESGNSMLQIAPFFDAGVVWNVNNNPNQLQTQTFLAGVGLGILWQPIPSLNMRLDYGLPLIDLDDRGENAQDDGFYFSLGYKL